MGIHGIYKEIGAGARVALSKLAVQKFEQTGRPFRLAIDTSIWLFQIQSSKGGTNPALRTFFYRLLRLISLSIHPLFVFDGPNKPPFKRNKRTGANVASIPEFLAKQLLVQFGFPYHLAPGEAEAECALLQKEGIVDAVLSEDVDTLMFGSGITLRNWTPEGKDKTPSHVNVYDAEITAQGQNGLDKEGMVLVALMSGGDYIPEGVPGCGPKTACEAARAGFGKELCALSRKNKQAFRDWRDRLQHELTTNESKHFRTKHAALKLSEDFPNREVLGYYTNPAVSSKDKVDKLRTTLKWDSSIDLVALRSFTADAFKWTQLGGAKHFIRNLAPPLLIRELYLRGRQAGNTLQNGGAETADHVQPVLSVLGARKHISTDETPELRVGYVPHRLVPIDLDAEEPDDVFPSEDLDGEDDAVGSLDCDGETDIPPSTQAVRAPTSFDPTATARLWVPETYVKFGAPHKIDDWRDLTRKKDEEAAARIAKRANAKQSRGKAASANGGMSRGALDRYAVSMKPGFNRVSKARSPINNTPVIASQPLPTEEMPRCKTPVNQPEVVSLISPSPSVSEREAIFPPLESPMLNVTVRRRRSPLQRSRTLPADLLTTGHIQSRLRDYASPPVLDHLDLTTSEVSLESAPAQLEGRKTKRVKITSSSGALSHCATRSRKAVEVVSFPAQHSIDSWVLRSPQTTPSKQASNTRAEMPSELGLENHGKSNFQIYRVDIEQDEIIQPNTVESLDLIVTSSNATSSPTPFTSSHDETPSGKELDTLDPSRSWKSRHAVPLAEISSNPRLAVASSILNPNAIAGTAVKQKQCIQVDMCVPGFWEQRSMAASEVAITQHSDKKRQWLLEDVTRIDLTIRSK